MLLTTTWQRRGAGLALPLSQPQGQLRLSTIVLPRGGVRTALQSAVADEGVRQTLDIPSRSAFGGKGRTKIKVG